jgi:GGDEF domain-containing protein
MAQVSLAHGEITEFRLRDAIRNVLRDTDLASTNAPGEVVILLADARATGARAFASRLRETVAQKLNQEPSVWIRSFPELEETRQAAAASAGPTNGRLHNRRASDRQVRG